MQSLDRFDSSLLDSPEAAELLGECHCGELIFEGDPHIKLDDAVYCDTDCLISGIGAEVVA